MMNSATPTGRSVSWRATQPYAGVETAGRNTALQLCPCRTLGRLWTNRFRRAWHEYRLDKPPQHSTSMSDDTTQPTDASERNKREARLNHDASGRPLGIAVFLGAEDIDSLGIDSDGTDSVAYWVEGGKIRVDSAERWVSDE